METRVVEGKKPYTGGKAISIDENKVISLNLRDENNLIIYDSGDDEIYVDLQLPDGIKPTDAFPVGITTGRVLVADDWDVTGTLICAKTTSGDNIKILYGDDGTLWMDNGTGTFKQIYFKADIDALLLALRNYIDGELAKKQNGVTSATAPTNPSEGDLWYDTTNDVLKVYDGSQWNSTGGGGNGDVQVSTDTGNLLSTGAKLWVGTESDFSSIVSPDSNTMYIQYVASGGGWQPGANTVAYYPLTNDLLDHSGNNVTLTTTTNSKQTIGYDISGFCKAETGINAPVRTISVWIKVKSYTQHSGSLWAYSDICAFQKYSFEYQNYHDGSQYNKKFVNLISSSILETADYTLNLNEWYYICNVMDFVNNKDYGYVNGIKIFEGGNAYASDYYDGPVIWADRDNYKNPLTGTATVSNIILEDIPRTAQEILDYYNQTKGNYGIS